MMNDQNEDDSEFDQFSFSFFEIHTFNHYKIYQCLGNVTNFLSNFLGMVIEMRRSQAD